MTLPELNWGEWALQALAFVLTFAIHSTLLLGLACLLGPRLVRSLEARERLWKTAMFGGIFTALVQVGASMETPLFHWTLHAEESAQAPLAASVTEANELARNAALESSPSAAEPNFAAPAQTEQPLLVEPDADVASTQPAALQVRTTDAAAQDADRAEKNVAVAQSEARGAAAVAPSAPVARSAQSRAEAPARFENVDAPTGAAARTAPDAVALGDVAPAPLAAVVDVTASSSESTPPLLATLATRWREWTAHGLLAWSLFALAVLATFGVLCLRLARCMRGRRELEDGELRATLDELIPRAFPRGRHVRLYVAPELRAPVSFGFLRPAICVPPRALVELGRDEQATMLAHELAHLMRRDPLWLSLAWLVERVFFFQPLLRVARAELHDLAELACDDWAARRTGNRLALASCLARIAEWVVGAPRSLPATSMAEMHGRCRLAQRIERLLDDEAPRAQDDEPRRWGAPLAAAGLGVLVLVVPGVSAPSERDMLRSQARDFGATIESASTPSDASEPAGRSVLGASAVHLLDGAQHVARTALELALSNTSSSAPAAASSPDERSALEEELELLSESLGLLRSELGPLRDELVHGAGGDERLVRVLDLLSERVDALDRRRAALGQLIQVLETLESMPAHPSSTPFDVRDLRSFPR
jgi:Zn-dependent protease with chaperone function